MSVVLTPFEQSVVDSAPTFCIRATPSGVTHLVDSGVSISFQHLPDAGQKVIESDGIFANSLKFKGGVAGSSANYLRVQKSASVMPTGAMTITIAFGALIDATPSDKQLTLCGCYFNGGYVCALLPSGQFGLTLNVGGSAMLCYFDRNLLDVSKNLVHFVFDGRYLKAYVNKQLVKTVDRGSNGTIGYSSNDLFFSATVSGSNTVIGDYSFMAFDMALFAVNNAALTQTQINSQYGAKVLVRKVSGTALLDDGSPATKIMVHDTGLIRLAAVVPDSDGSWSADVPPGSYWITAVGPAGYRPVSHGPVVAVST